MKNVFFLYGTLFLLLFLPIRIVKANSLQQIKVVNTNTKQLVGRQLYYLEDKNNSYTINQAMNSDSFQKSEKDVPNFGITESYFWIKFTIESTTDEELFVELAQPIMDEIKFYNPINSTSEFKISKSGEIYPFSNRQYNFTNYVFNLNIHNGETKTYFLKIKSTEQTQVPVYIGSLLSIADSSNDFTFYSAIFLGIMVVMIFYNLFIYISIKDKSYLFYVLYIFILTLTQLCPKGITFQYFWPNSPWLAVHSMFLLPSLVGIFGIFFFNNFLKTKELLPFANKVFKVIVAIYLVVIFLALINKFKISYMIMEITAMTVALLMLLFAGLILKKGYQPAKYFLIAWSLFLSGIFLWVFKDLGLLPYNLLTNNSMQLGAASETILLSFALAARINIYKKEKEISQKQAFLALEEKEQLVREQNVMLESKVEERTHELHQTLDHLKEAQSQLVDSEKMASLGQLTAGIAHEINNPINFVSSNIPPLKQDITDLNTIISKYEEINASNLTEKLKEITSLKQALDYDFLKTELVTIINGIENGANRTTEIVKSLRNFSRLDEDDLILADINEGILSTLVLLKSTSSEIQIIKNLNTLPKIECYPGKLNQVFLNILNNAIQAIQSNIQHIEKGSLRISTIDEPDYIKIIISDNGCGINEEIKDKIFDPFFTTKEVGKGTGLGLSIVYRIIENHRGKIAVRSKLNEGTTFTISLPKKQY